MNINSNINFLLGLSAQLKVMHWQTKGYSRHQAFGSTYDSLGELMDNFVEEAMGKYGRFKLDDETSTITLVNLSDLKPEEMINTVKNALIQYTEQFEPTDTNLLNIRDEMLGLFNKLSYLLTLE
jgi:DNA-binding ferritin-like protein